MNKLMLCESIKENSLHELNTDKNYQANIKYDGERIQAVIQNGEVLLVNRRGRIKNSHYGEIVEELRAYFKDCVLDGEIISEDDDFNKLQRRALTTNKAKQEQVRQEIPVKFMVFDILSVKDKDLTNLPLRERLSYCFEAGHFISRIELAEYDTILTMLSKAKKESREGIVIKDMDATYENRRSKNWLKLKFFKNCDLILTSYTPNNAGIRCEDDKGNAVQISGRQHQEVKEELDTKGKCEVIVQYLETTKDGKLRFPSYVGTMKATAKEESIRGDFWGE